MMIGGMTQFGSAMAGVMFLWAIFGQAFSQELGVYIRRYIHRLITYFYPYLEITFHEHQEDSWYERSKAYVYIQRYLSTHSSNHIKRLKANVVKDCKSTFLSMDDYEEVTDEFKGIKIWWTSSKTIPQQQRGFFSYHEKRFYKLTCKRKHRDIITKVYLQHVLMKERLLWWKQGSENCILITRAKSGIGGVTLYSSTLLPLILLQWTQRRKMIP